MKLANYPRHLNIALILIVASLLLHLLIAILTMTYAYDIQMQDIKKNNEEMRFVLFQEPAPVPLQNIPPPEKHPNIVAGKAALDAQSSPKVEKPITAAAATPVVSKPLVKQKIADPEYVDETSPFVQKTPTKFYIQTKIQTKEEEKQFPSKKMISILQATQKNSNKSDQNASDTTKNKFLEETKNIHIADLGLGNNSKALNFGNSAYMSSMQGTCFDVPTADQLKVITYKHQIAKTLCENIFQNEEYSKLRTNPPEKIEFLMLLARDGKLLKTEFFSPSRSNLKNEHIFKAITSPKLYNAIPKYINKETMLTGWCCYF